MGRLMGRLMGGLMGRLMGGYKKPGLGTRLVVGVTGGNIPI